MLTKLITQIRLLEEELAAAIDADKDSSIVALDRQLTNALDRIRSFKPEDATTRKRQINFLLDHLLTPYQDLYETDTLSDIRRLVDEYVHSNHPAKIISPESERVVGHVGKSGYSAFQEIVNSGVCLDNLFESDLRISIINCDGKYQNTSRGNAAFYGLYPDDFRDLHVSRIIGDERYDRRARVHLEKCFDGSCIQYFHELSDEAESVVSCEMLPYRPNGSEPKGAVVIMRDITNDIDGKNQPVLSELV